MPVETIVTFQSSSEAPVRMGDHEVLEVLGRREEAIAIKLKEMLTSVKEAVRDSIDGEGELSIEISGALEMKASAGIQYLVFNVGPSIGKTNAMKVTLKTKITSQDAGCTE